MDQPAAEERPRRLCQDGAVGRSPQIFAVSGVLRPPAGAAARPRSALLDHALSLTGVVRPKLCFIPTAVGDDAQLVEAFYAAFDGTGDAQPSHLQLFTQPNVPDVRAFLLSQDLLWVSGGSVVNQLAVWRAHGLDEILRECWESGVVLGGGSAGSLCWHVGGPTDSFSDQLDPVGNALAFLPYSNGVHHDFPEQPRRSRYLELVGAGVLPAGYATDDGAGLHYIGTQLVEAVSTVPGADAYWVEPGRRAGPANERPLGARTLASVQHKARGRSPGPSPPSTAAH